MIRPGPARRTPARRSRLTAGSLLRISTSRVGARPDPRRTPVSTSARSGRGTGIAVCPRTPPIPAGPTTRAPKPSTPTTAAPPNNYLGAAGVPVRGDNGISLVDTSYEGTVQEMLTALYPRPRFEGLYAFHGQDPSDPHPDAKRGYLVDLGPEDGAGKPLTELPADPARTFAHQDAIGVIEETLHGTMSSPRGIGPDGPVQQPQRFEADPTGGINPLRVAEPSTDPAVREGAKAMSLRAVVDVAEEAAARRAEGGPWRAELAARAEHGRDQVRSWVAGDDPDPRFREVMDSLVRRGDKGAVEDVEELTRDLDPEDRRRVWAEFDALPTVRERAEYAARMGEGRS
ncbi:hypothetical protein L6E12_29225 [Actinokineospora sp. PR83]|uniref:hypothetical protein n=1 Tax=Actinokineospora sp. PR83 TaxID=2884908 RepID=UPI001F479049|nr:hypothetical protein [Actinokineospora sp. PR83]MCG8919859.1 hypothetical protein [Actinokineospora sp. PR83]